MDEKKIKDAFYTLRENCREHHETCEGCPLFAPRNRNAAGIPSTYCLAAEGATNNTPPAFWRDIEGGGED